MPNTKPQVLRILSIDPGTTVTGYALSTYDCTTGDLTVLKYGKIQPTNLAKKDKEQCALYTQPIIALSKLQHEITSVIKTCKPDFIVTEDAFLHPKRVNAFAALKMCILIIAMVARDLFSLPVYKLAPCHIKKIASGTGTANKITMQEAILNHPEITIRETKAQPHKTMSEHEADAIAVAIAFKQILPAIITAAPGYNEHL